jgi:hypothetical protein
MRSIAKLGSLSIKSLNVVVKSLIEEKVKDFSFDNRGCIYLDCYYDFRVSKAIVKGNFICSSSQKDTNIHINQISEDEVLLAIIFKDKIKVYLLDKDFFNNEQVQPRLTYQHKNKYLQLHIPLTIMERAVSVKFDVK